MTNKKEKTKSIGSGIVGSVSAFLAALGIIGLCPCTIPILGVVFSVFGITSLALAQFSILFLAMGVVFIGLALYFYKNHKKTCKVRK